MDTNETNEEPELTFLEQAAMDAIPDEPVETYEDEGEDDGDFDESEEESLDSGAEEAQDKGTEDSPAPSGSAAYMRAINELRRDHVPGDHYATKSEAEIIAMGETAAKNRADRERDYQASLTRKRETEAEATKEEAAEPGATGSATPLGLEEASNALVELYGEEDARPHIDLLEAQAKIASDQQAQIEALKAQVDGEAQARQREPLQKRIDEMWTGLSENRSALSEPGARENAETLAAQLYQLDPKAYKGMEPTEWMPLALERAADSLFGPAKAKARGPRSRTRAQPTSPGSRSRKRPETGRERMRRKALEIIPD